MHFRIDEKGQLIVSATTVDERRLVLALFAGLTAAKEMLYPVRDCKVVGCTQESNDESDSPRQHQD